MNIKTTKLELTLIALILSFGISNSGNASGFLLDDFSHAQSVLDKGNTVGATSNSVVGLSGTALQNASRTFTAEATTGGTSFRTAVTSGIYSNDAGSYLLDISNTAFSAGNVSIDWSFNPINLTAYGNAILLKIYDIDLNVSVEMIANGIASSGVKTFSNADDFLVTFNEFSNNEVFTNLSSFRLNFTGPQAWDGQFKLLATGAPVTVPVPPSMLLMGAGLMGLVGITRKKSLA